MCLIFRKFQRIILPFGLFGEMMLIFGPLMKMKT